MGSSTNPYDDFGTPMYPVSLRNIPVYRAPKRELTIAGKMRESKETQREFLRKKRK